MISVPNFLHTYFTFYAFHCSRCASVGRLANRKASPVIRHFVWLSKMSESTYISYITRHAKTLSSRTRSCSHPRDFCQFISDTFKPGYSRIERKKADKSIPPLSRFRMKVLLNPFVDYASYTGCCYAYVFDHMTATIPKVVTWNGVRESWRMIERGPTRKHANIVWGG